MGMDGMLGKAYLTRAMLRRILACLALITGLAAIGTPAEARMMLDNARQMETAPGVSQGSQQVPCSPSPQRTNAQGKAIAQPGCQPRRPIVIYIPTVQFGPDRAFE